MKQDVFKVFGTNIVRMGVAFFATFILPIVLSVDAYANVKWYQLYVSYIGLFHLGYCDGVYLKYGGENFKSKINDIKRDFKYLQIFQIIVSIGVIIFSVIRKDGIIFAFGLTIFPRNMRSFFEYVYQATGRFSQYAKVVNGYSILTIFFYFILIVLLKITDYKVYIFSFILIDIFTYLWGYYVFSKDSSSEKVELENFNTIPINIKLGLFLMLGNFANTFFLSIDKWCVKYFLGMESFAYYSFATQLLLMITMFITPVTMTLYNYLSQKKDVQYELEIRKHITFVVFVMLSFGFVAEIVVKNFISHYVHSISLIYILMLSQVISSINTAVFVNLFKTYKMQNIYFKNLLIVTIVSVVLNFGFFGIMKNIESFAYATLCSMIFSLLLNMKSFSYLKFEIKEICFASVMVMLYIILLRINNPIAGAIIYLIAYIIIAYILRKEECTFWYEQIKKIFSKLG